VTSCLACDVTSGECVKQPFVSFKSIFLCVTLRLWLKIDRCARDHFRLCWVLVIFTKRIRFFCFSYFLVVFIFRVLIFRFRSWCFLAVPTHVPGDVTFTLTPCTSDSLRSGPTSVVGGDDEPPIANVSSVSRWICEISLLVCCWLNVAWRHDRAQRITPQRHWLPHFSLQIFVGLIMGVGREGQGPLAPLDYEKFNKKGFLSFEWEKNFTTFGPPLEKF